MIGCSNGRPAGRLITVSVRKPGLDNPFIDLKDGTEQGETRKRASPSAIARSSTKWAAPSLALKTCCNTSPSRAKPRHAMLELNDGGMGRLTKALRGVAHLEFKLARLQQQRAVSRGDRQSPPGPLVRKRRRRAAREKTGHRERAMAGAVRLLPQYGRAN